MASETQKTVAPYASFKSVMNFLDKLQESYPSGALPQRLDRSTWGQWFSGGYGPQVIQALKFLDLLNDDLQPAGDLTRMVHDPNLRPGYMGSAFRLKYPDVLALDLTTATMGQLQEIFRERYGVSGDTLRKAIVFFQHGAEFAGIPLGDHLRPGKRRTTGPLPSRRNANGGARRTATSRKKKPAIPLALETPDFSDLKRKYLEALIKKIEDGDADSDLLNRVEELLFEQAQADKKPDRERTLKPGPES